MVRSVIVNGVNGDAVDGRSVIVNGVEGGAVDGAICYCKWCWRWHYRWCDLVL